MEERSLKCTLKEGQGKKGSYLCLIIQLTDEVEKMVFLDKAETQLLKLYYENED